MFQRFHYPKNLRISAAAVARVKMLPKFNKLEILF